MRLRAAYAGVGERQVAAGVARHGAAARGHHGEAAGCAGLQGERVVRWLQRPQHDVGGRAGGVFAVGGVGAFHPLDGLQQRGLGLCAVAACHVLAIRGHGDGGQDGDDREHDHHFDQREAARRR
ncbi:hypothetical protein SDC9_155079 [bioreactor metagenome]|uniref:Uncharacterized protein n=1 Tax=bioreactor metagenome TaxID=1076179 RepID=A0A645F0T4_9ZZZZ